jgi:hypothetical protein
MMINIHVMNIIFFNTWATWAVEGGMSSQKVFINDDVDHAYSNVMMKMFWWYDYDQDDQDNYDVCLSYFKKAKHIFKKQ